MDIPTSRNERAGGARPIPGPRSKERGCPMTMAKLVPVTLLVSAAWLAPRSAEAADSYKADPVHSSVVFKIKHMNTSYSWGRFNDISGTFALDEQNPAQSQLNFQVKTASVDTGNPARDRHIKSPDFLNAVQFSTITFKSKSVSAAGKDAYEVSGDLTLHGVTKPVTVKLNKTGAGTDPRRRPIAGIEATFTLKRSEFGMTNMVGPIGDEVWLNVSVEGGKQ
jgi:polyisoprenoid-binding protein YceI